MNIIKNSSVALTIGPLEFTGRARARCRSSVLRVRGVRRGDRDLPPHQRGGARDARSNGMRVPGLIAAGGAPQAGH